MDPKPKSLLNDGREVHFIDEGKLGCRPIVFFGGLGTGVDAFYLTEFARDIREELQLRVISVERNGFGETRLEPSLGYADAVDDVLAVLASLTIERFAVVAFSGGGPFAAKLAARVPERLRSLHLAAAAAGALVGTCGSASEQFASPVALAEDPALAHEWELLCGEPLPDLSAVTAPAYLYWGADDDVVPLAHVREWRRALPNVVALRGYGGEAHDVQYRHWDQILLDAAGLGAWAARAHSSVT
jgi:non-heme chloroperoxidase